MAGSTFDSSVITTAAPYWYERLPYTATASLSAGGTQALISAVTGWQPGPQPSLLVTLEDIATAQDPNLQVRVVGDGQSLTLYSQNHPSNLEPVRLGVGAVKSLSATLLNTTTATSVSSPLVYHVSVLQMPAVLKVLLGYPPTTAEQEILASFGLPTTAIHQNGQQPIPIGAVIERTFLNRQVLSPVAYDGLALTFLGGLVANIPAINVGLNQLFVLTEVAVPISKDYGPQVNIARDYQENHVQFDPSVTTLDRPMSMWIPATQQVSISVTVTSAPPGAVPCRVKGYVMAMSNILRVRMGQLSKAGLETLFQQEALQKAITTIGPSAKLTPAQVSGATTNADDLYNRIVAGVV